PAYGAPQPQDVPVVQEPARLGPIQRLGGTLFSPGETFEDVNRKPTWIVPILIAMVTILASTLFFEWRVKPNWDQIMVSETRKRVEKSGQSLTEEQIQQQAAIGATFAKFAPLLAVVFTPIIYLILAGIFALGLMFIQAKTTFKKVLSVVAWSGAATGIVALLVTVAVLFVRDPAELRNLNPSEFGNIVPSNIGAFLSSDTAAAIRSVASSLDVFTLWWLILLSIGFAAIAGSRKITSSKTGAMVFGFWLVFVVLKVAWAAAFG
ncbi:MAG TPA: YIP1 family protein, partial [Blastocatellia bacterium]|nr:YIP1 family protein [Blastocatellia bacterium]